jgi:hypothetical protein
MEEQDQNTNESSSVAPTLDEGKLLQYREKLRMEQNLPMGFVAGFAAALLGALLWAIITVSTGYQIGWMAVGVGFLVGFSINKMGRGIDKTFGIMGAALALLGCLMGNMFTLLGVVANEEGMGYFELFLTADYSAVLDIMIETFSPMDILFYGIAIYEGYKFSFRQLTEEEIRVNAMK